MTAAPLSQRRKARKPNRLWLALSLAAALTPLGARASAPGDPWEPVNRRMFRLTVVLERTLFAPVLLAYKVLTPGPIGKGVHNVLTNLSEPVVALNDLLQGKPKRALGAVVRVAINSTAGVGGLIDVTARGDPHHDNSFGTTLGRWGVGPGPYLFVPVVGPSDLRDGVGLAVDVVTDPLFLIHYPHKTTVGLARGVAGALDNQAQHQGELRTLLAGSADPYATLRSVYLQQRQSDIEGASAIPSLPDINTPGAANPPPQTPLPSETPASGGEPARP